MSARWNTATWNYDRWPALLVTDLLQQPPDTSRGVSTGIGDWRLSVEILLPLDESGLWGVGAWDESTWNRLAWQDLTPWVRGLEWARGADEVYGRPRVGQLQVTLDSTDDRFDPWNPSPPLGAVTYFAPGTIVRVGVRSATDTRARGWLPQITAIVDTWGVSYVAANKADRFVDFVANETLRDLAQIDDNALGGLVGGGEDPVTRFERLLDAAGWRYGLLIEAQNLISAPGSYPLQSTDMANNRLAECYLVADSCDTYFRSDRTGAALVTNVEYISVVGDADPDLVPLVEFSYTSPEFAVIGFDWQARDAVSSSTFKFVPYRPDDFQSGNSDDAVVNDCRFTRVGGTQQVFEQIASIERHGRRTLVRNDLIVNSDLVAAQIAQYTSIRRALNTLRVDGLTVDVTDHGETVGLVCMSADVGDNAYVFSPDGLESDTTPTRAYITGFVRSMTHKVTPRNSGSLTWEATYGVDTRTVHNIPGAQLPFTPA